MPDLLDAALLSRIQFAFTMAFHIVFPAFTIGLASYLAVLEALWLITGRGEFIVLYRFWLRIFALSFGMGVVSGIVMSYQFGTNWGPFADATGPVLGPLLSYEVMTAFFLEAGFLGVMLFGIDRVGRGFHFCATLLVALGTLLSAFWILAANSWMHTPQGYAILGGQFVPEDWFEVIFNPSFPYRLVHMVLAAYLTNAFVVGAVGAYHLSLDSRNESARIMLSMALWMALATSPVQAIAGDLHGLNTFLHQPAKIAAIEGHWETRAGAPLILIGMPDMEAETTHTLLEVPQLGSLILVHDWDGEVPGLKAWPAEDRPYAPAVFWSFRIMVGIGLMMIAVALIGFYLRLRGQLAGTRWFHWLAMLMGPSGFVAVIAGWVTTEVGRQPYLVYGAMRTAEGRSPIAIEGVAGSFAAFLVVYLLVFGAGLYYLLRLMRDGPQAIEKAGLATARAANLPAHPARGGARGD